MRIGKWRLKRVFMSVGFVGAALFVLSGVWLWLTTDVRSYENVRRSYQPSDIWIVDQAGEPLEAVRTRHEKRSLSWVKWSEVAPAFRDLLIEIEDRRYFSHFGVDPLALGHAFFKYVSAGASAAVSPRGASTITMQLDGLLSGRGGAIRRNWKSKLRQIVGAVKLEASWTKTAILEAYINHVPFRGELVGLRAASQGYFGKNPSGLAHSEAALLIALLRAPNAKPERVAERACRMLKEPSCDFLRSLAEQKFSQAYRLSRRRETVPVLSQKFVREGRDGSVIETSLDRRIQELALRTLREQLRELKTKNVHDGAVLVLETKTGRVLAYAANGGSGFTSADQIDGIQTRKQAGSTVKPFVFATAFEWNFLKPDSLLEDSPADIAVSHGRVYRPRNYDHIFRGFVSAGEALGSSMNVPTVRALRLVGEGRVLEHLRRLGFDGLQDDDFYGPSLALGTIDVTLWELTQGYRQLGLENSPFSLETREKIFNILAAPEYRRHTFGMGSVLTLPFPAAVKTGTSKDMRDNWCIGWTDRYTVGVWVGNFNGEPMRNVSGMSGAAPIWSTLMRALHPQGAGEPVRYEPPAKPLTVRTLSRIRYPAADMLVGLDPDIPKTLQKLPIEIENPQRGQKVYLNRRLLREAQETLFWPLSPGKHQVELREASGKIVDSVKFEVR